MKLTQYTELHAAITRAGWADMITAIGRDSITVSVLDTEACGAIRDIRRNLPSGAVADFAGSSNTDADGDTTGDIRVTWAAM